MPRVKHGARLFFMDDFNQIINQATGFAASGTGPLGTDLTGTAFEEWLYPGAQQQREFGQQVALQQMQNEWNSEQEKMRRAKEAGINPATAAGNIAGDTAPSTGTPNSSVASGANIPASIDAAANTINSAVGAYEKLTLTPSEKKRIDADRVEKLQAAGLNYWEAKAIAELLPDRKSNLRADTYLKIANYQNTCEEYHNIVLEHDKKKAEIDRIQKEAYEAEQRGDLANATRLKVEAETRGVEVESWFKEQDKNFWLQHGYHEDDEMDIALRNAAVRGNTEAAQAVGEAIEDASYHDYKGRYDAEVDDAFELAFNECLGRLPSEKVKKALEIEKDAYHEFFSYIYSMPSTLKEWLIQKLDNADPLKIMLTLGVTKATKMTAKSNSVPYKSVHSK